MEERKIKRIRYLRRFLRSLGPQIVAMLFLAGFVAYAAVWQEPASSPPGGNVPSPINVGPAAQTKQGDLTVGGALKVEGNLLDNLGRIIYNAATGKIDRARLPYEQGDITSDVDTNTYDGGYFNVSSLIPGNIIKGIAFGRNATGTAEPLLNGDLGAIGILSWGYSGGGLPGSGTPCYSSPSYCRTPWYGWYGSAWPNGFIYNSYNPRGLMSYQVASVKTCYSTFPPCPLITLPQSYTINCSSGWIKTSSWVPLFVGSACTNGYGCEGARCTWGTPPPPVYTCPPYCGSDE